MEHGAPAGAGPVLVAGGCGMPAPRITPLSPDPTLAPRAELGGAPWDGLASLVVMGDPIFSDITSDPSVPPPRA